MANVYGNNAAELINALDGVTNGADDIFGYGGNDSIFGLGGNDVIRGGLGADAIDGGGGSDYASYDDSSEGVVVSLVTETGAGGTAEGDTLTNIENLTGSLYADWLTGNGGSNVLAGFAGDDLLDGGLGADTLYGDSGNDTLKGGGGADTLNGGTGVDTASYYGSNAGVLVSLIHDTAAYGHAEGDELNGIENLSGSAHDDDLLGSDGSNVLEGGNGDDTLKGYGGADGLYGGNGEDTLLGMDGSDALHGGSGNDVLNGGGQADELYGDAGADAFEFRSVADSSSATGVDTIVDFDPRAGDVISLRFIDADGNAANGNTPFTWVGAGELTGTVGELCWNDGFLEGDIDGDAVADLLIAVATQPDAANLVL